MWPERKTTALHLKKKYLRDEIEKARLELEVFNPGAYEKEPPYLQTHTFLKEIRTCGMSYWENGATAVTYCIALLVIAWSARLASGGSRMHVQYMYICASHFQFF